jgi:hypothetical protein
MEAMDRAPRLQEKSTETSGYVRRMTKAAADSELCLSCGDLLHWDRTLQRLAARGFARPGTTCRTGFREALGVEPDAALPGSACHGVKLCPIARHGRKLRRLGKFLKDKQLVALSPVRVLQPKRLEAQGDTQFYIQSPLQLGALQRPSWPAFSSHRHQLLV